ncbi:MAG: FKBP-type peptidyl-prolyl cis-trans isomerase [Halopseudomonas sp.]
MIKLILILAAIAVIFYGFKRFSNNPQIAADNVRIGEQFLSGNATEQGVQTSSSGLQYKVLEPGSGTEHPGPTDRVKVHYHGTLIDGTVFDSSVKRGEPIDFGLNQVIAGWTEGLQTMVEGEKTRLFIPSQLGYGNSSAGSIPPGSVLIFDVELLAINP